MKSWLLKVIAEWQVSLILLKKAFGFKGIRWHNHVKDEVALEELQQSFAEKNWTAYYKFMGAEPDMIDRSALKIIMWYLYQTHDRIVRNHRPTKQHLVGSYCKAYRHLGWKCWWIDTIGNKMGECKYRPQKQQQSIPWWQTYQTPCFIPQALGQAES